MGKAFRNLPSPKDTYRSFRSTQEDLRLRSSSDSIEGVSGMATYALTEKSSSHSQSSKTTRRKA